MQPVAPDVQQAPARRRAVASLPTMTAAASRRSCARSRCPNRPRDRPLERARQLPRRRGRAAWRRPAGPTRSAAGRHRPRGRRRRRRRPARPARPPRRRRRAAGTGRRSSRRTAAGASVAAAAARRRRGARSRSVGSSRSEREQERERLAGQRVGVEGAEQPVEVGRGQRRPLGRLERPGVEDDADARHARRRRFAEAGVGRPGRPVTPASRPAGARTAQPPRDLLGPQLDDDDQRLDHDPPAHLRLPDAAVAEGDRDLADARARRGWPGTSSRSGRRSRRHGRHRTGRPPASTTRHALKPPVRSFGARPRTIRAKMLPPRETSRRPSPQSTTPPPVV